MKKKGAKKTLNAYIKKYEGALGWYLSWENGSDNAKLIVSLDGLFTADDLLEIAELMRNNQPNPQQK